MHRQATDFKDLHAHAWHCTLMVSGFFNRTADSTEEAHCQAPGSEKSSMIDISMNLAATKECACRKSCDVQMKNDQPRTSTARTAQTSRILRKLLINLSQAQVPKQFHGLLYKDRPGPEMRQQCKWIQTQELKMQHPTRGKCQAAPGCPHIDGVLPEHVPMCLRIFMRAVFLKPVKSHGSNRPIPARSCSLDR